ncbi:uncharacterized protein LOC130452679 [Diorhabda sublineata]|uniref:uncharacterized protein LOC130452679 n=1 Tax=Diorhabda sublineata TaxID=1163346 RepID=UPI0024E06844|nr:uncharacterized protein LOC130452679 [Diorhabda sublineata]XP_056648047.1 uncharacterized protein LOC130452679 [Diorhabda sublineata]XP_056648048.1 uncharacterized protein LOC130452679 [Diorhabda sublineata]XP_056648049.1 uncharacterized protein LOC130452679 [Diorhabda sublineata]
MTIFKHFHLLSFLSIALYSPTYSQSIPDDRKYGCTWHGGSVAKLSCNCEPWAEMILKPNSIDSYSTSEILINGCKSIRIEANAISQMRNLRTLALSNVGSIDFSSDSINWYGYKDYSGRLEEERFDISVPSLKIHVYASNISRISSHAFAGRISEITLEDLNIVNLEPLAFVNLLQTEKISLRNTVLINVGVQAFKKFSTEHFELISVTADLLPSRAISNITVYQNVTIHNCVFNTIRSGGFTIYNPKVLQVTNNKVQHLSGEAFKVISRGFVLFRDNDFGFVDDGAFLGVKIRKDTHPGDPTFIFDSNRLSNLSSSALQTFEPGVQFKNIYLGESCDCLGVEEKIKESEYYAELQCLNDGQYTTVEYFKVHMCSVVSNYFVMIIIVSVIGCLLIVVVSGLLLYYKFVYRTRKYGNKNSSKKGPLSLIVPDGRTYRETELHVIVERTDLLTTDL